MWYRKLVYRYIIVSIVTLIFLIINLTLNKTIQLYPQIKYGIVNFQLSFYAKRANEIISLFTNNGLKEFVYKNIYWGFPLIIFCTIWFILTLTLFKPDNPYGKFNSFLNNIKQISVVIGLLGIAENFCLLKMLNQYPLISNKLPLITTFLSLCKWGLLICVIFILVILLFRFIIQKLKI